MCHPHKITTQKKAVFYYPNLAMYERFGLTFLWFCVQGLQKSFFSNNSLILQLIVLKQI